MLMAGFIARFWKNRSGATAIEYSMIAVLIAVAIITGASAVGTAANGLLNGTATKVTAAAS
jgi:pilus assembly protein Flp/PilA